jgi:hypothetical protein
LAIVRRVRVFSSQRIDGRGVVGQSFERGRGANLVVAVVPSLRLLPAKLKRNASLAVIAETVLFVHSSVTMSGMAISISTIRYACRWMIGFPSFVAPTLARMLRPERSLADH